MPAASSKISCLQDVITRHDKISLCSGEVTRVRHVDGMAAGLYIVQHIPAIRRADAGNCRIFLQGYYGSLNAIAVMAVPDET